MTTMQAELPPKCGSSPFPAMPTRPSGLRGAVFDPVGVAVESTSRKRQETRFASTVLGEDSPMVISQAGI